MGTCLLIRNSTYLVDCSREWKIYCVCPVPEVRHCNCLKHTKSGPRACGVLIADKRATSRSDSGLDQRREQVGVILYSGDTDFDFRPSYDNKAHFRTCIIKYIRFTITGQPQVSECSNWSYKASRSYLQGICFESRSENCLP
jgi:hypothetical protein